MADIKVCEICKNQFDADVEGGVIPERTGARKKIKMVTKCQSCLDKSSVCER